MKSPPPPSVDAWDYFQYIILLLYNTTIFTTLRSWSVSVILIFFWKVGAGDKRANEHLKWTYQLSETV